MPNTVDVFDHKIIHDTENAAQRHQDKQNRQNRRRQQKNETRRKHKSILSMPHDN